MGDVVSPPDEGIGRQVRVLFMLHVDVNHAVVAIGFDDGGDEHDGIAADFLDEGRVFHSETVGKFHEHFRSAGFGRVDAAVGPVDGLAIGYELLRFGLAEAAGIGETSCNFLVAVEFREIGFVGHGYDEHLAAFFGRADAPDFDPGAVTSEQAEIGVDVLGVIENIGRTGDVMECGVRCGNARAERKMVHEFGDEEGFGGELFDLLGVLGVVAQGTWAGLGEAGCRKETQREENAEQAAVHGTPQGDAIAGDFIDCFARRRNRWSRISTIWGQLAYDWPPLVLGTEERDGWKSNLAWIFCGWWKTRQLRRRARWDSGTGTMPMKWPWKRCARPWTRWRLTERL